jgi:hypothetical protein
MNTEDSLIDQSSDGKNIEQGAELLPEQDRLPLFALIIEAVHFCYLAALVISSQQVNLFRIQNFVSH